MPYALQRFLVDRQMRSVLYVAVMVVIVRLILMYISLDYGYETA